MLIFWTIYLLGVLLGIITYMFDMSEHLILKNMNDKVKLFLIFVPLMGYFMVYLCIVALLKEEDRE